MYLKYNIKLDNYEDQVNFTISNQSNINKAYIFCEYY